MKASITRAALASVLSLAIFSANSFAQSSDIICAAILPCDQNGQVLAPFKDGACAEIYARQCASEAANQTSQQLLQCQTNQDNLERRLSQTLKQNRKLIRRLRKLDH